MRSALARLGFKQTKKGDEEFEFDSWYSGGKGDGTAPQANGVRYFSFEELQKSTDNFSQSRLLGTGGYSQTYLGFLTNGGRVAIKTQIIKDRYNILRFKNEFELLSRVHHKNIASLVGFCFRQEQLILVYEHIPNGSLGDNLMGSYGMHLDWRRRLQIAIDSARVLAYLHELTNPQIIHRNVTSSNILLDEQLNAKFIGFGLSKLNRGSQERIVSSQDKRKLLRVESHVEGTFGYLAPEYVSMGQLSELCDVFGFGMVMLELITGKKPFYNKDGKPIALTEVVTTAIDLNDLEYTGLRDLIDSKIIDQARNNALRKFVLLALACTRPHDSNRPFMSEVVREIEMILLQSDGGAATNDDYSDESKYHDRQFMSEVLRETGMMSLGSDEGAATDDDYYYYSDESNNST